MSESLSQKLEKMVKQAQGNCARMPPTGDKPPEYQWGFLQGKFAGLVDALKVVIQHEQDEQDFEDNL